MMGMHLGEIIGLSLVSYPTLHMLASTVRWWPFCALHNTPQHAKEKWYRVHVGLKFSLIYSDSRLRYTQFKLVQEGYFVYIYFVHIYIQCIIYI